MARCFTIGAVLILFLLSPYATGADENSALPQVMRHETDPSFWDRLESSQWAPVATDPVRNAILEEARRRRRRWPAYDPIDNEAREKSGIRRYSGKYVTFYTDLPASESLDGFVHVFDAALPELCRYFRFDLPMFEDWHIEAFLMSAKEPYEKIGALKGVPPFQFGYSHFNRVFVLNQGYDYYNRFLILHELIHTFMHDTFGDLNPRWFSEGIAEFLALHRIENDSLKLGIIPAARTDTPGFLRMETIKKAVKNEKIPSIDEIFRFSPNDYRSTLTYSWSWAFVLFLENHPSYKPLVDKLPYYMMANTPSERFRRLVAGDWNRLQADWFDFAQNFDYAYDLAPTVIDYKPGIDRPEIRSDSGFQFNVPVNRGWSNTGLRLEAGKTYQISGSGRFELYDSKGFVPCESWGVTYRYVKGRPRGALLVAVLPDPALPLPNDYVPWADPLAVNAKRILVPKYSGTLYARINDTADNLTKNRGNLNLHIRTAK